MSIRCLELCLYSVASNYGYVSLTAKGFLTYAPINVTPHSPPPSTGQVGDLHKQEVKSPRVGQSWRCNIPSNPVYIPHPAPPLYTGFDPFLFINNSATRIL